MTLSAAISKRLSTRFSLEVELAAPPGVTILFGASGSGKSTILRCLAGLLRPDTGHITIGETPVFDSRAGVDIPVQRRKVGYVFQQLALFPHMSVAENIGYGLDRLEPRDRQQRVSAIAESFRIADLLSRRPSAISGGERQRAALARTLVTEPEALLLDEPLTALDHAIQSRIMDDLRRWNGARHIPVVYVTHAHREVYTMGDRVIAIDGGRVIATGSPHDVLEHPAHDVLAHLAGFENIFAASVVNRRESAGTMQVQLTDGTEMEVPLSRADAGSQVRIAIRAGDILLANQPPAGISARNILRGTLEDMRLEGPTMMATVRAGASFVVHLTPGSVDALGIGPGSAVWLIVKTCIMSGGTAMTLLTVSAAAARLGIGYSTLKQWIYNGTVRTTTTPGGHHRIAESEIDRLIARTAPAARARTRKDGPSPLIVGLSGRNKLRGYVEEVRVDGLLAQVRLRIGDQMLTAVVTADAVSELKLKRGDDAVAIVKATEVMIAREVEQTGAFARAHRQGTMRKAARS